LKNTSFRKGEDFEKYVEQSLFLKKDFDLVHRTNNFDQNKNRFAENTLHPDFKFRCKKTNNEFYIEAKFRSKFNQNDKLEIMSLAQKERFIIIQKKEKVPVFIVIGYEGWSNNPDKISLIPLNELIYLELYPTFLQKFNIEKENINSEFLNLKKEKEKIDEPSYKKTNEENINSEQSTTENDTHKENKENKEKKVVKNKKKNILFFGIIALGLILLLINKQIIFKTIFPPEPNIIHSEANSDSSTLFEYSTKVIGTVMNKGGDGYIVIKASVYQNKKRFTKSKQLYLLSNESEDFEFIFDEVKFFKETPSYSVETFKLGSQ
tara:strand:+ start:1705 stop:2667 length:963 start_codon:yes stop_codon:yes gene_type:complete